MGRINVLSFAVANLIAAGEVVDRPASVIKELMENAIDADAKHITVEIQNGGVTFMRVTDDGCGMEPDDMPVAIRRHATSKIKEASDLEKIFTLGFRGEALAAIASVSEMRIMSKQRSSAMGAMLQVSAGEIVSFEEAGCPDGTTIIVEALFANVPARRKFLKKDVTESQAVTQAVERVSLSHPEIAFRLIVDGETRLSTAGDGKLQSAVYAVFGREFANRLIPLSGEYEGVVISGFIGRPDNVKGNRNYQNFFINGRWIKSKTAMAALEQAFCSYLAPEKFPTCVMNITLNPAQVDVNVHPAKLEVKFSNEKLIFEAIYYAVRHALEQNETRPDLKMPSQQAQKEPSRRVSDAFAAVSNGRPGGESVRRRQLSIQQMPQTSEQQIKLASPSAAPKPAQAPAAPTSNETFARLTAEEYVRMYVGQDKADKRVEAKPEAVPPKQAMPVPEQVPLPGDADVPPISQQAPPPVQEPAPPPIEDAPRPTAQGEDKPQERAPVVPYRIVGELFHSYVVVEQGERMLLIDKHAAHERVLFEQLKAKLHSTEASSQLLMLPVEVMMMSDEVSVLSEYRAELEVIGFAFETARNTVSVSALPVGIDAACASDMLFAIADRIKNNTGSASLTRDILFEKALYQGACKAAIKAGRAYAPGHVEWLVEKLMQLPDITFCPHGRPVAMEMSKQNLDHQFERS